MPKEKGPRISYEIPYEINKELELTKSLYDKIGKFKSKHNLFDEVVHNGFEQFKESRIKLENSIKQIINE